VTSAMSASASGMAAQQVNLDLIADNLANADVAGFKGSVASFTDLRVPGTIGFGTAVIGTRLLFEQGKLMKTGGPFDVALDGPGFFEVRKGNERAYTRAGSFERAADGTVHNAEGWRLEGVRIPADALRVDVHPDGAVAIDSATQKGLAAGKITAVSFAAPERLRSLGSTLYAATANSGPARRLDTGAESGTKIAFGMLESSNVSIIESMMSILAAQRAYEANAKGVQAADEMLRIVNNLHRS
jgi:flagellar basal-body rod protein FlgG